MIKTSISIYFSSLISSTRVPVVIVKKIPGGIVKIMEAIKYFYKTVVSMVSLASI